jgi:hypothetical protein
LIISSTPELLYHSLSRHCIFTAQGTASHHFWTLYQLLRLRCSKWVKHVAVLLWMNNWKHPQVTYVCILSAERVVLAAVSFSVFTP